MALNKVDDSPQIISYPGALKEIKDIVEQLNLKNLYSLLGYARGLMKYQKIQEAERGECSDQ